MKIQKFLNTIYQHCLENKEQQAVDFIMDEMSKMLELSRFRDIKFLYEAVILSKLTPVCIYALFVCLNTFSDHPKIKNIYKNLYPRAYDAMSKKLNSPEKAFKKLNPFIQDNYFKTLVAKAFRDINGLE